MNKLRSKQQIEQIAEQAMHLMLLTVTNKTTAQNYLQLKLESDLRILRPQIHHDFCIGSSMSRQSKAMPADIELPRYEKKSSTTTFAFFVQFNDR